MTNEEILKYVKSTPENTNPAILRQMVEEYKNEYDLIIRFDGEIAQENTRYLKGDYNTLLNMITNHKNPKVLLQYDYIYGDVDCYLLLYPLYIHYYPEDYFISIGFYHNQQRCLYLNEDGTFGI